MIAEIIGHWMPIILIILIISFAFGDNPLWRFAETVAIGAGLGNAVVYELNVVQRIGLNPIMSGSIQYIIPIIFGLLLYFRFWPKYDWISRYGFVWMIAGVLGIGVGAMFQGTIIPNIITTISVIGPTPFDTFWKVLQLFIFLTVASYFIFARPHTGFLGRTSRIGRVWMMMALGIGYAVLIEDYCYRVIERVWFVLNSLGII